jgi:Replication initiation factor
VNWDWYSATLPGGPDEVLPMFVRSADLASLEPVGGMHSYDRGVELRRGSRVLARAFWGGVNGDQVHVQGSGRDAPWVVKVIRDHFPAHRVSRADAKEDYTAEGAWELLSEVALAIADEHGVKVQHVGDWHRGKDGRTLYLGGRTSLVQVRVYEKGKQLSMDPNWVRVEVQVRPKGIGKTTLSTVQPAELLGSSRWTTHLGEKLGVPSIAKLQVRDPWEESDEHRAIGWMLRQYGEHLERLVIDQGSWAAVGMYLGDQLKRFRKETQ